jgi:hypothetical protein
MYAISSFVLPYSLSNRACSASTAPLSSVGLRDPEIDALVAYLKTL